jgi:DNA polymerase
VLWRLFHGESHLLEIAVDPDVLRLTQMSKAIGRAVHKMRAFVRFREITAPDGPWYVAWFEPEHPVLRLNAKFFCERFAQMKWAILTPDECAHWDGAALQFTPGLERPPKTSDDPAEELWRTYYSSIFNPARVKIHAMQAEMPKKYWKNLPEAADIPHLLQEAPQRVAEMMKASSQKQTDGEYKTPPRPTADNLKDLRAAAAHCDACPFARHDTQTVFGEGPEDATIVLLGEQPGDQEDLQGRPFVGPAGMVLDRALAEAGVNRAKCYVTNAVKHFKWEPRGKRRIHQTSTARDIEQCRGWFEAELRALNPKVIVCLGGTASNAVLGRGVRVLRDRGRWMESRYADKTLVTVHPSSILRAPDEAAQEKAFADFVTDLRLVAAIERA